MKRGATTWRASMCFSRAGMGHQIDDGKRQGVRDGEARELLEQPKRRLKSSKQSWAPFLLIGFNVRLVPSWTDVGNPNPRAQQTLERDVVRLELFARHGTKVPDLRYYLSYVLHTRHYSSEPERSRGRLERTRSNGAPATPELALNRTVPLPYLHPCTGVIRNYNVFSTAQTR
jgi:hypothetical protein